MPEKRDKKLDGRGCSTGRDRNIFDHTGLKPAARTGTDEETVKRKQKKATENKKRKAEIDSIYFKEAETALYAEISALLNMSIQEAKDYVISKVEALTN